jgi:O-antigen ligase/polysaccharide polymerase Wzy-like membrane protein
VLTETSKSLGYRLQYWQATMSMITRHPWLGVGPGNFQDYYTQFKLPQASEEIRDPHNFLLEVWATAGTFALIALGEVLGGLAWRTWRAGAAPPGNGDSPAEPGESARNVKFMMAGGAAGLMLAFLVGPTVGLVFSEEALLAGLLVGGAVVAILWPWVVQGSLPRRLPALGVLVLAIHLLAAGGIAYPGVAGTFWILMALALNQTEPEPAAQEPNALRRRVAPVPALALAVACVACVACYFLAYRPVLRCHAAMSKGNEARDHNLQPAMAGLLWLEAAEADPLSPEPWSAIAELDVAQLKEKTAGVESHQQFVQAAERILELRPHSSAAWRQEGHWFMQLHEAHPDAQSAASAAECFLRAVELYPNFAALRGEYAMALHVTGKSAAARRQAEMAMELDRETPHADKKLPPQLRNRLEALLAESR